MSSVGMKINSLTRAALVSSHELLILVGLVIQFLSVNYKHGVAMRVYDHDELHKLIDNNPQLKQCSDQIHSLPPVDEWSEFERRKHFMVNIWADAVVCTQRQQSHDSITAVVKYFLQFSKSLSQLRQDVDFQKHIKKSKDIEADFNNSSKCHVAGGNSYVCFCNASG